MPAVEASQLTHASDAMVVHCSAKALKEERLFRRFLEMRRAERRKLQEEQEVQPPHKLRKQAPALQDAAQPPAAPDIAALAESLLPPQRREVTASGCCGGRLAFGICRQSFQVVQLLYNFRNCATEVQITRVAGMPNY